MFSPTRSGRVLDLCVAVLMRGGTGCGAGAPAAPLSILAPVASPSAPSAGRRQKPKERPQPKSVPATTRTVPAARVDSAALERAVTKEHAH